MKGATHARLHGTRYLQMLGALCLCVILTSHCFAFHATEPQYLLLIHGGEAENSGKNRKQLEKMYESHLVCRRRVVGQKCLYRRGFSRGSLTYTAHVKCESIGVSTVTSLMDVPLQLNSTAANAQFTLACFRTPGEFLGPVLVIRTGR